MATFPLANPSAQYLWPGPTHQCAACGCAGLLGSLPGAVGWVLRHRKWLVIGYAVLLHLLVYSLALSYASCTKSTADAARLLEDQKPVTQWNQPYRA